jgi:pimeloyl-ACP methyl ester carboxylesterase
MAAETTRPRTIESEGLRLLVREGGAAAAPTVVLVHGYPDTSQVWEDVAVRLRDRFHVVSYDVRGAGGSGSPAGREGFALDHLVADLGAVIDATSPGRPVHLVGHDWGSIQSWEAVTTDRLAGRIASFTSISGPCLDHAGHLSRRQRTSSLRDRGRFAVQAARSQYITLFHTPWIPELLWRSGWAGAALFGRLARRDGVEPRLGHPAPTLHRDGAQGLELYRANMRERLGRPRERRTELPVQLIVPTRDVYVTPYLAEHAPAPWVPNLRIHRIDAGHWVPRTHPAEVADLIAAFADEVEDRPLPGASGD